MNEKKLEKVLDEYLERADDYLLAHRASNVDVDEVMDDLERWAQVDGREDEYAQVGAALGQAVMHRIRLTERTRW